MIFWCLARRVGNDTARFVADRGGRAGLAVVAFGRFAGFLIRLASKGRFLVKWRGGKNRRFAGPMCLFVSAGLDRVFLGAVPGPIRTGFPARERWWGMGVEVSGTVLPAGASGRCGVGRDRCGAAGRNGSQRAYKTPCICLGLVYNLLYICILCVYLALAGRDFLFTFSRT